MQVVTKFIGFLTLLPLNAFLREGIDCDVFVFTFASAGVSKQHLFLLSFIKCKPYFIL
jgi:hypothetical protein